MHEGRIKPLDTVAREEVKQIYGRETIKLHDPAEEIDKILDPAVTAKAGNRTAVQSWGPVGAFLDWSVVPEFWDEQPFILVDYLPLRRQLMAETIAKRLKAIAREVDARPPTRKPLLAEARGRARGRASRRACRVSHGLQAADRGSQDDRRARRQAHRRAQMDDASRTRRGPRLSRRRDASLPGVGGGAADQQTPVRRQSQGGPPAYAGREAGDRSRDATRDLQSVQRRAGPDRRAGADHAPRRITAKYLADTPESIKEAREKKLSPKSCRSSSSTSSRRSPLTGTTSRGRIATIRPRTASSTNDTSAWLRDNSVWVPLKVFLKSKPDRIDRSRISREPDPGVPGRLSRARAGRIELAGHVSQEVAARLLKSSRELGEAVNPTRYPTVAMIERETHFNAMNPFWQAPFAYGAGVVLLGLSAGIRHAHGQARPADDLRVGDFTVWAWPRSPPASGSRFMGSISACGSQAGRRSPTCMRR